MKKVLAMLLTGALAVAVAGCGGGDKKQAAAKPDTSKPLVIKLSHVFSPAEQLSKSMVMVTDRIRTKTKGRIDIQCFGQGQIATYKDGLEQVAQGADFISVEDPSYVGDYVPDFKPLVGPMMYESYDEYIKMIETPMVKDMIKKAEEKGVKILALDYIFGFRNLEVNKVINKPEDLKGMKLRVPGSKLFIDTINAMGATATGMPYSETLSAVSAKTVDGLEGSEFSNHGTKVYEVCKNVATTKHFLGTCGVYISPKTWAKMTPEEQKIVADEFAYGGKEMTDLIKKAYDETKADLVKKGVKFNDVDHAAFNKAVEKVYIDMEEKQGATKGISKKMHEEVAKIRASLKK